MFVGDKGKILAGFRVEAPRLIPESRMAGREAPPTRARREQGEAPQLSAGLKQWVEGCKGGKHSQGAFENAGPISEAMNLYAISLRTGRRLVWDAAAQRVTNFAEANKYLSREYRKGWELESV